jgi:hypothetical protein
MEDKKPSAAPIQAQGPQPPKKPLLDVAVFGGFTAVKSLWRALGAGLWIESPYLFETEQRSYQLRSLETAMSGASTRIAAFLGRPRPGGCIWVRGIQEPYGPDYTPPEHTLKIAITFQLPVVVLHFARPKQLVPDEAEINLRELLSSLGASGDEIPVLQCPAFEEAQEILSQALLRFGPFLDEHLPIPPEKKKSQ